MTNEHVSYWVALNGESMVMTSNIDVAMATYKTVCKTLDTVGVKYNITSVYKKADAETLGWAFLDVKIRTY